MDRIYFTGLGVVLLLTTVLTALSASAELSASGPLAVAALVLASGLFVVGGLTGTLSIGTDLQWYRFIGAGTVLLGVSMVAFPIETAIGPTEPSAGVVASAIVGAVSMLIGVDFFRGGVRYDLSGVK